MKVFNFGHPLSEAAKEKLAAKFGEYEVVKVDVHINLGDEAPSLQEQMLEIVKPYRGDFDGAERMVIISPGMSNAAWILAVIINGLSGRFPELVELRINSDKVFDLHQIIDLQEFRNEVRKLR